MNTGPRLPLRQPRQPRRHARPAGFTLIELMIVTAVVTLLLMVALPAFRQQIMRSHRLLARSALMDLSEREERARAILAHYSSQAQDLGYAALPVPVGNGDGQSYYVVSVTLSADSQHYTAVATPIGAQGADASCYAYTIDDMGQTGNQDETAQASSGSGCW